MGRGRALDATRPANRATTALTSGRCLAQPGSTSAASSPLAIARTALCLILLYAGTTCLSAGRIDEAASHTREALAFTRRLGARGSEAHALCLAGDVASTDAAEDADGYYREALALAGKLGMRPLLAHCHPGLGKLYRRRDQRAGTEEHLTTAATMYREMGMRFWLEQGEAEMGEWA